MSDSFRRFLPDGAPRLDRFLADCYPEPGRSRWTAWVRSGQVKVDGEVVVKAGIRIRSGATVETCMPPIVVSASNIFPENIDLPTIFEDEHLWVINKPAGIVVHPSPGHSSGTVLNALLWRLGNETVAAKPTFDDGCRVIVDSIWPGLVHRLDRYTTGCLTMAKDVDSQRDLQLQFKNRTVKKRYLALVRMSRKLPEIGFVQINKPIARHKNNRLRMAVSASGRPSQTRIRTLAQACGLALVECELLTGRTHQIRLHLSHLDAPILGDSLYGGASSWLDADRRTFDCLHPMLHAWKLSINHPCDGHHMSFTAPLPVVYKKILADLGIAITCA